MMISWSVELLLLISFLFYLLHLYISRNFDYWKKRNVPFIKPKPYIGNIMDMLLQKYDIGGFFAMLYERTDAPFFGIFVLSKPALVIKDAKLLKHILVKDFDHFVDRSLYAPDFDPAVAHMLFAEKGDDWRTMRSKMSPFFSPSKTKSMFGEIDTLAVALCNHIITKNKETKFDAKDISNRFTVDCIAKCVFGIDSKSLENDDAEFLRISNKVFDTGRITCFRYCCYFFYHSFARIFKMRIFDPEAIDFLRSVFWECIEVREKENIKGNDLIDIMVNLRKDKEFCERMKFEGDKVIAQAFLFFVAGFETTASVIAFTFYMLCLNQNTQKKLRKNIMDVMKTHNGNLSIEAIQEMSYLDMVAKETLRKYSPAPILDRVCTKEYKIPGTDVVIDKGTIIIIPAIGIQMDQKHFINPEEYMPERFEDLDEDVTYLPFGHGPRQCIGRRLGLLMVKLAIVRVLQHFEVHPTDETPLKVEFSPRSLIPQPTRELSVRFVKVDRLF